MIFLYSQLPARSLGKELFNSSSPPIQSKQKFLYHTHFCLLQTDSVSDVCLFLNLSSTHQDDLILSKSDLYPPAKITSMTSDLPMGQESKFIITQFTRFSRKGFLSSDHNLSVFLQILCFNQDILIIINSRKAHIFIIDNTFF